MLEVWADVTLGAGMHALKLCFFEDRGACGLKLSWMRPGQSKELVPADHLFASSSNVNVDCAPLSLDHSNVQASVFVCVCVCVCVCRCLMYPM
jgi:hypothetical protein